MSCYRATVFYSIYLDMLQVNSRPAITQFSMISFLNQFSVLTTLGFFIAG